MKFTLILIGSLLLVACVAWGITALVQSDNAHERSCERNGGTRVYVKGGLGEPDTGHYCVKILYKD